MKDLPYRQAFDRIRAEYLEMPGMRLTPAQVERLSGVDVSISALVLDDLVRAQFLCKALMEAMHVPATAVTSDHEWPEQKGTLVLFCRRPVAPVNDPSLLAPVMEEPRPAGA